MQADLHDEAKKNLLSMKAAVLNKALEFKGQAGENRDFVGDEADAASQDSDLEINIHLLERDRLLLYNIEKALMKIEKGAYDTCEGCGGEIAKRRLLAKPFATLCIECQEEHEQGLHL